MQKKINKMASQMKIKVYEVNPIECGGTLQDIVDGKKYKQSHQQYHKLKD